MVRKLASIGVCVVIVWLLMVQVDALSGYQPRFGVWAREYVANVEILNNWQQDGLLPNENDVSNDLVMQYNYATILAQHGENIGLPDAKSYWEQSIEQYETLLDQESNMYALHNKTLLEKLLEQTEEQNQGESGEDGSQGQDSQEDGSQPSGEEGSQQPQQGDQNGEEQGSQGETPQESGLSEKQLQQLQDYQEQLQQQQFQNQQHFGKQPQDQQPQSIFDQFFGDPQFKQGGVGVEKDW